MTQSAVRIIPILLICTACATMPAAARPGGGGALWRWRRDARICSTAFFRTTFLSASFFPAYLRATFFRASYRTARSNAACIVTSHFGAKHYA